MADLKRLTKADTKESIVAWLNSLLPSLKDDKTEESTCIHIANQLMDTIFNTKDKEKDALKPYATAVDKEQKNNPQKYPSLIMTYSKHPEGKKTKKTYFYREWNNADKNFTDSKQGKWYLPRLVHLGGILKYEATKDLPFPKQWSLAEALSKKLLSIADPAKERDDAKVYLDDFATQIKELDDAGVKEAFRQRQVQVNEAKNASREKTLEKKKQATKAEQAQMTVVSPTETKELKRLASKLKDIERDVDKMTTGIKDALRELGYEIAGTIRAIELQRKK